MLEKVKRTGSSLFIGKVTVEKKELWLMGAVCLLAGIVYGIRKAPWTHGVTLGSYNRNSERNTYCCDEECCNEECCAEACGE